MNSPLMKSFGESRMREGECVLVVDLDGCIGMDSTFMGTLAGMAARLSAAEGGAMQVVAADERNRRSLEDLGLDFLMQINPEEAEWLGRLEEIRSCLEPAQSLDSPSQLERARHVLQAHEELSDVNQDNAREFRTVVGTLRDQISGQPNPES